MPITREAAELAIQVIKEYCDENMPLVATIACVIDKTAWREPDGHVKTEIHVMWHKGVNSFSTLFDAIEWERKYGYKIVDAKGADGG